MLLSQNNVLMNDAALYGTPKREKYIETRVDYSQIMELPDGEGTLNAYISTYIMMDDSHKSTIRNVSTFAKVFSDTGGFMTITFLVTVIIV